MGTVPVVWAIVIILVAALLSTFAMGVYFISVPLALLLVGVVAFGFRTGRRADMARVERFRAQSAVNVVGPDPEERDRATLYRRQ